MVFLQNMGEAVNNLLDIENRQAWNGMEKVKCPPAATAHDH